jgi:hypothetical protein
MKSAFDFYRKGKELDGNMDHESINLSHGNGDDE